MSSSLSRLFCLGLSLLLAGTTGCRHPVSAPAAPPRIVAYGDSITRGYGVPAGTGWVELLAANLKDDPRTADTVVFNAGGDGNTSAEGLARFGHDVQPHLPALVLVEFGGNDVVEGDRNVTLADFERNLREIHRRVAAGGGRVVFVTFPPVIDAWHGHGGHAYFVARGGLDAEVERCRARTRTLARELGVPLFDLDHRLRARFPAETAALIDPDGVHLTPGGNRVAAAALLSFLRESRLLPPAAQ